MMVFVIVNPGETEKLNPGLLPISPEDFRVLENW